MSALSVPQKFIVPLMRRQTAQQVNKARSERGDYAKIRMCDFRSARVSADDKPDAMQNPAFRLKNGL
ncbi:hypothetical protein [Undibacterium squillarum]|uniref:Uncharacterized protein n=1 Tax=Undibacterium squillarum TaxID=1131567 RepID=A0ABQ2XRU0_9BURK|nr:hypothetical protein [Undibacterium squillarum]GGX31153.1 hypothetical protein GCM10010946_05300 [Undibacterium squillarum]